MSEVMGIVQKIDTRAVSGGKIAYNLVVQGKSFGAGLYAPKANVGDYVKFEVDNSRGFDNIARGTLKVSKNKPPAEAVQEAEATKPVVSTTGASFDTRQDTISRQAATNTAIEFMKIAQTADALGLPTGAKGNKIAHLESMLLKYSQEFYERNTGVAYKDITPNNSEKIDAAVESFTAPALPEVAAEDDSWE